METVWWILVAVLFILAYAGLILPGLPDAPFVLGGFLVYHFFIDPVELGWSFWVPAVLLVLLLLFVDYIAGGIAAKKYGGSKWSVVAAVAGVLIFPLFLGPIGIIVGPFILVFISELLQNRSSEDAFKIAFSTLVGFLGGVFVKFLVITFMIVWFLFQVFV